MSMKPGQTILPLASTTSVPFWSLEAPAEPLDLAVREQDILHGVEIVRRIDDAAAPEQEAHAPSPPFRPARRSRTPMRTATPRDTWSRMTEYGTVGDLGRQLDPAIPRARDA